MSKIRPVVNISWRYFDVLFYNVNYTNPIIKNLKKILKEPVVISLPGYTCTTLFRAAPWQVWKSVVTDVYRSCIWTSIDAFWAGLEQCFLLDRINTFCGKFPDLIHALTDALHTKGKGKKHKIASLIRSHILITIRQNTHSLSWLWRVFLIVPLLWESHVHAPESPVKTMSRGSIVYHFQVIVIHSVKHRAQDQGAISLDTCKQRLRPKSERVLKNVISLLHC